MAQLKLLSRLWCKLTRHRWSDYHLIEFFIFCCERCGYEKPGTPVIRHKPYVHRVTEDEIVYSISDKELCDAYRREIVIKHLAGRKYRTALMNRTNRYWLKRVKREMKRRGIQPFDVDVNGKMVRP